MRRTHSGCRGGHIILREFIVQPRYGASFRVAQIGDRFDDQIRLIRVFAKSSSRFVLAGQHQKCGKPIWTPPKISVSSCRRSWHGFTSSAIDFLTAMLIITGSACHADA